MRHTKALFRALLVTGTLATQLPAQTRMPQHPLDGLTTQEYWTAHDVLFAAGHLTDKTLVSSLLLHEPSKDKVLAWKQGDPIPREADVILLDDGKTYEARIDLAAHKLEQWKAMPGVQAPVMLSELDALSDVAKKDPRVIAGLKARGITDLSTVSCDPIPLTVVAYPQQATERIGFGSCTDSHNAYHPWGRSIEGLYILANMTSGKILDVIDRAPVPLPPGDIHFEEAEVTPRPGTRPLLVTQPLGPSFTIERGEITWQNWHFRFRLDPRVGPVINLVRYQDGEALRSILYEGSLSEMYVPYMDPGLGWSTRAFVDAGEFLMGGLIKPVGPDDCPSQAQYFTGLVPSEKGTPVMKPQLACLFEHATDAPAWRHSEDGLISGRPARELVLRTAATVGNYDYLLDWVFQQDGTIRVAAGATGIVETKAILPNPAAHAMSDPTKLEHGTPIDTNMVAVNHDHYFSYRLDLDVDGTTNSFMVDKLVPEHLTGTGRTSIWGVSSSIPATEREAIQDLDGHHPAMWHFINPAHHGKLGAPSGYEIMPGATGISITSPDDPAQRIGAFSEHQLWVTPYQPDERYASGTYVTNNKGHEGLPTWTAANRNIKDTDIVAWYTLGFHHVVRQEDWPVMPTLWHDFLIRPANFFDRNPVLTLPHQP